MGERTCQFCKFANRADGLPAPLLVCDRSHQSYTITQPADCCRHFTQGKSAPLPGPDPGTCLIPLTQGKFAIVDAANYDWLSQYKWYAIKAPTTWYAARHDNCKAKLTLMHRIITSAPAHLCVDHIDRNGLNNTPNNLRLCTHTQNMHNAGPQKNSASKYKGVKRRKNSKIFQAAITCNGKRYNLGSFKDEKQAARTYDKKAKELFGEFAYLNFPEE